ncbi:hypothetical protein HWQ46_09850 [Shewanella sp. D64]|uniref:phage terminase small subunit n=1 Tax=unclassified Shewanella TaxID=196818 RepID=UPI0022BA57D7|nr:MULTISPECIES: phage terminase small subunit [unclassified Shewanella]MEC4725846.1 hypothetical protein [Shewanella sp. D64]WBJ95707.1 hypothetical protein HWQ47_00790 [Shewanella sp. MTB7]
MISPAADHRNQQTFKIDSAKPCDSVSITSQFQEDMHFLKCLERKEDKQTHKREVLLPRYLPEVTRYLQSGKIYYHAVMVQCTVWLFDTEQFELALAYTGIATKQGQISPFKRSLAAFAADAIYLWAVQQFEQGRDIDPYFAIVLNHLLTDWKLPEQLCAKYFKLAGLYVLSKAHETGLPSHIVDEKTLRLADSLFLRAEQEHYKIGVKTHRNRIEMRLKALAAQ